jgi:hypothetical protein
MVVGTSRVSPGLPDCADVVISQTPMPSGSFGWECERRHRPAAPHATHLAGILTQQRGLLAGVRFPKVAGQVRWLSLDCTAAFGLPRAAVDCCRDLCDAGVAWMARCSWCRRGDQQI